MSKALDIYNKYSKFPFGKSLISKMLTIKAPYFSTIKPTIVKLEPGLCSIMMKDRRAVRNHLGTVHAIAMCNLCELSIGLAAEVSLSPKLRWIAKNMNVQYLKKAKGTLTSTALIDPKNLILGDVMIPVEIKDTSGTIVVKAEIGVYISEKPKKN